MCGVAAAERTVTKESPNKGRRFWTCEEKKCEFFEWVDGPSSAGGGLSTGNSGGGATIPTKRNYPDHSVRTKHLYVDGTKPHPRPRIRIPLLDPSLTLMASQDCASAR